MLAWSSGGGLPGGGFAGAHVLTHPAGCVEQFYPFATIHLQAKSYGDAELLDRLEGKARIVALQQRLADALLAAGGSDVGRGRKQLGSS